MKMKLEVKNFEDKNIRTIWNEDQEKWFISIDIQTH
jgi:prophage antirepressor-like protein